MSSASAVLPRRKPRPCTFKAHDIKSFLDGSKTQFRLLIEPALLEVKTKEGTFWCGRLADGTLHDVENDALGRFRAMCPSGQPGDQLWIKEPWQVKGFAFGRPAKETYIAAKTAFHYRATDTGQWQKYWGKWRPAVSMPAWACRLMLEITSVRVERVQDISDADVLAEAVERIEGMPESVRKIVTPQSRFALQWEMRNGHLAWRLNPFVWVVTVKKIVVPERFGLKAA